MTPDPHEYCYVEVCGNSNQCAYHEAFNAGIDKTLAQIRAAVAAEREACARVAESHATVTPGCMVCNGIMGRIAAAIRARATPLP